MIAPSLVSALVYTFSLYWKAPWKKDQMNLYRDDGVIILCNINKQQTNRRNKKIISVFKIIDSKIEIKTNLLEVNFLGIIINLVKNTNWPWKKPMIT